MFNFKYGLQAVSILFIFITSLGYALGYNPNDLQQFNETNQCPGCDLSSASVAGNHSQANLIKANLTNSSGGNNFSEANFSGANMSSAVWTITDLSYANFEEAVLINAYFDNSNLEFANFTNAVTFGTSFVNADLYSSNITQSQMNNAKTLCGATMPDGTVCNSQPICKCPKS